MTENLNDLFDYMTHKVRGEDRYLRPLFAERVNGKYIIAAYQGSLSKYDILIKYRQLENGKWSNIRTPKHIHWSVDVLIKMKQEPEKTRKFLDLLINLWNDTKPIKSEEERLTILNIDTLLTSQKAKYSDLNILNDKGEYSLNFLMLLARLLMLQEKTNYEHAFMFKNLLEQLKNCDTSIYQMVSTATHH